jgi:hypothetical protein
MNWEMLKVLFHITPQRILGWLHARANGSDAHRRPGKGSDARHYRLARENGDAGTGNGDAGMGNGDAGMGNGDAGKARHANACAGSRCGCGCACGWTARDCGAGCGCGGRRGGHLDGRRGGHLDGRHDGGHHGGSRRDGGHHDDRHRRGGRSGSCAPGGRTPCSCSTRPGSASPGRSAPSDRTRCSCSTSSRAPNRAPRRVAAHRSHHGKVRRDRRDRRRHDDERTPRVHDGCDQSHDRPVHERRLVR